jgi:hypothetical protein
MLFIASYKTLKHNVCVCVCVKDEFFLPNLIGGGTYSDYFEGLILLLLVLLEYNNKELLLLSFILY